MDFILYCYRMVKSALSSKSKGPKINVVGTKGKGKHNKNKKEVETSIERKVN